MVIGGGRVAERKIESLLKRGARVKVIAPEVTERISSWAEKGLLDLELRNFQQGDLKGAFLVIAATNNPQVQQEVFAEAEERQIFCNVVDKPDLCSFIVPSVLERGHLQIAISTSGASPALARRIRKQLEEVFGPEYAEYLELLALWRKEILSRNLTEKERRQIFEHLVLAPVPLWIKRGEREHIKALAKTFNLPLPRDGGI